MKARDYKPKEGPSAEQQRVIAARLEEYFVVIDEKTKDIPESQHEEIFEEAIRSVRPGLPTRADQRPGQSLEAGR